MLKDLSLRRATGSGRRFSPLVFLIASLAAATILVSIVAIPQFLSQQARMDVLRSHVGEIGQLAASVVDGDLHRQLLDPANYSDERYARALKPLVRFHSANPDIFYLYTMVDRGGTAYFVLDTATSPDLQTKHRLRASAYMEKFDVREQNNGDWLKQIAAGKTYVTPSFEQDDFGSFLTSHVPIYDSKGLYSGFVGVDFDMQYYLTREARFRSIAIATLGAALLVALVTGYLVAVYHASIHRRMQELYDSSIRDSLTGLLNRRGAMQVIKKSVERHAGQRAMLLVDIDNLKMINDMRGHATGDAVVARVSEAIRDSVREGDECARLGDEFLIFAPDCDTEGAAEIARRILGRLSREGMPLVGAPFSVSVGIALHTGAGADFARMHREADEALHQARAEGRNRIGVFEPSTAAAFQPDRPPELTVELMAGNSPSPIVRARRIQAASRPSPRALRRSGLLQGEPPERWRSASRDCRAFESRPVRFARDLPEPADRQP
ncbi:MAG TPA: GGDEF domain-containing protein [Methyloceanibacter sp.]